MALLLKTKQSNKKQTNLNNKNEKGRIEYQTDLRELLNDPTRVVTMQQYEALIASQSQPLSNELRETSKQSEEIQQIAKQILHLSNQINELNEKQDVIMEGQISIHNDIKSYGEKTLDGIKVIKDQGGDIFKKCFPPKELNTLILCFNKMFILILKLLHFIFSLYYNTSYICINITKSTLGKIPLFGLLLAPLFELCATIVFVWLTMTIVTKSSNGMIDAKQILIASIRFLRYMLQYVQICCQ